MTLYLNYGIMAIGIGVLVVATLLIFLDKLKGEDLYFNMDMKEQELKKIMEDADELIDELNYSSELVISDMEKKYGQIKINCEEIAQEAMNQISISKTQSTVEKGIKSKKPSKLTSKGPVDDEKKLSTRQLAVIEMAARGIPVTEIAREMNMGQGEVSLILSLRNEEQYGKI